MSGKIHITERNTLRLLKEYNIPVIDEGIALNKDEAVRIAAKIGFPVVVKGFGVAFLHKTEKGLVCLNLDDSESVRKAAVSIRKKAGNKLEGFVIQPYVKGKREFAAGMFRDKQFGPIIMFGLGGIFIEAVSDIVFRLAPLTENDASEMLDEIKSKSLFGKFRGEDKLDRNQLIEVLINISRLAVEHPEINQIDINPLLVNRKGKAWAVDSLFIADDKEEGREQTDKFYHSIDSKLLQRFFYPESIAFIGASGQLVKWGHMLLTNTISGGFRGKIYPVNPKTKDIAGRRTYKTVLDIPGKVDLAVVTIPADGVVDLIPQLKEKQIKNVLLITSGFGETGKDGKKIEKNLAKKAKEAGILIIGPNTMGICNPHINFYCTGSHVRPFQGVTSFVSQSGYIGTQLLVMAEKQGIGFRCFCGSGNEAMITIEDYLEALKNDPLTSNIILYVESVKQGRRFFENARSIGQSKPVVLLKGGRSKAGNRAMASHTGALSSDNIVFDSMCRQAGIIRVNNPTDLLDFAAAFSSLPLPEGNRAAIVTFGGGWGVIAADLCSEYGLEIPELPPEIVERINKILPCYWSRSNPVDLVSESDYNAPMIVMEELIKWDGCDAVINLGIFGLKGLVNRLVDSARDADPSYSSDLLKAISDEFSDIEKKYINHIKNLMEKYNKPVFGVSLQTDESNQIVFGSDKDRFKAVFYPEPDRAAKAFAGMYKYCRFRKKSLDD